MVLEDILCDSNVEIALAKMSEELNAPYEEQQARQLSFENELLDLQQRQARIMEAYEKGAYTVDDYIRRITPLREAEAELKNKRTEAAGELDQAAILTEPQEVLAFTSRVADFIRNSPPKDRKQMLNRFIKCVWIEPGKGTVVYRIPLPNDAKRPQATELVLALDEPVPPTVRVCPPERMADHMDTDRLSELMRSLAIPAVPHGDRSSFRNWAGARGDISQPVAETVLAHTQLKKLEGAYLTEVFFEQRQMLMQEWGDYLSETMGPVVPIAASSDPVS